jgi:hypothetical protein
MDVNGGFMEGESDGSRGLIHSGLIHWIAKLTGKIAAGKIVPMHYGETLPPPIADRVSNARAIWIVLLNGSRFEIEGLFANPDARRITFPCPAHNKRRIMFPCPVHNELDSEAQADVIRRSKLAQNWGVEVKWVDHEILESMIIINPPTESNPESEDGIALIDLSLPHLDTTGRAKFEITQKHQGKLFSDLVKSFSLTWTHGHDPHYEETKIFDHNINTRRVLKGIFVA